MAASDLDTARKAAMAAVIEYEDLEPVLDVVEALRKKHFVLDSHTHQRGDASTALSQATHRLQVNCTSAVKSTFTLKRRSLQSCPLKTVA